MSGSWPPGRGRRPRLRSRPAALALVILAAVALASAGDMGAALAGDGRALDAAASWSAPRPLDMEVL